MKRARGVDVWEISPLWFGKGTRGTVHHVKKIGYPETDGKYVAKIVYIEESYNREVAAYNKIGKGLVDYFVFDGNVISKKRLQKEKTYVLILDFIDGVQMKYADIDPRIAFEMSVRAVYELHKNYGIAHGDPHAENIILQSDNTAVLIDFEDSIINATQKEMDTDIEVLIGSGQFDYDLKPAVIQAILKKYFGEIPMLQRARVIKCTMCDQTAKFTCGACMQNNYCKQTCFEKHWRIGHCQLCKNNC